MYCLKAERRPSPRTQSLSRPQNQTESAGVLELEGQRCTKSPQQTRTYMQMRHFMTRVDYNYVPNEHNVCVQVKAHIHVHCMCTQYTHL